jgi:hypothetical protein
MIAISKARDSFTKKMNCSMGSLFLLLLLAAQARSEVLPKFTNRLIHEKSPYLLQHAHNPVEWYPWGDEAFRKAKEENKPIFLSIGYSTCHWCHVMEQESFSDPLVAEMMNATFVSIKVDREERPDIDSIYMTVSQMVTGGGGWPNNIIMTPDKKPFFASTYIPKDDRFGRPGMLTLIPAVAKAWRDQHEKIVASADAITTGLRENTTSRGGEAPAKDLLDSAFRSLETRFDPARGGFLPAPKFPSPHQLMFLLRYWKRSGNARALQIVEKTLDSMRRGGIFDQVGFGFHRYSTDPDWLVPHFEKMLYDQAMLAMAYTEAFQATHKRGYEQTAKEIFTYVLRDMRDTTGGFYSAEDADSEGEEGKFYLWSEEEIRRVTGDDAQLVIDTFGVKKEGNFRASVGETPRGANILHLVQITEGKERLERARHKLFAIREKRVHPGKDDKILTDWNGLMISALAKGAQAFDDPAALAAARKAADFFLATMRSRGGKLLHRYRGGEAAIAGKLDDYAFLTSGLLDLYEASFDTRYLQTAIDLTTIVLRDFPDRERGGFFMTAAQDEVLLTRPKDGYDGAIPSGNSVMILNLLRLGRITGKSEYEKQAEHASRAFSADLLRAPSGFTAMLNGLDFAFGPSREIVVAGTPAATDTNAMLREIRTSFLPNKIVLLRPAGEETPAIARIAPFTAAQRAIRDRATVYVCTNYVCKLPTSDVAKLKALLMQ